MHKNSSLKSSSSGIDQTIFLKKIDTQLFLLLLLMIACFFTWSENVIITRAIKLVGRMGILLAAYLVYKSILRRGAVDSMTLKNNLSPILYLAYLGLGLISFLWTSDIGVSALQWFMITQTLVFSYFFVKSLLLLDTYFPEHKTKIYNLISNATFCLILIFAVGMISNPEIFFRMTNGGEEARLGGYLMNPNELGMLASIGIAVTIADFNRGHRRVFNVIKLLILFDALYFTGSRSSLIGVLLIVAFYIRLSANLKLKIAVVSIFLLLAPLAINKIVFKDGDSDRVNEVLSMTGRLPFWKALITEGLPREPLLGFGFMRIDYKDYFQSAHTYPGKMTHNTFMQVLMNLGFIGLTVLIFQVFFTVKGMLKEAREKRLVLLSIFIPVIINSFTEFGIFGESNYGILFYQLIILLIAFKPNPYLNSVQKLHLQRTRPELSNLS